MIRFLSIAMIVSSAATVTQAAQGPDAGWRRIVDSHGSSLEVPTGLQQRGRSPESLIFTAGDGTRITFETITEPRPGFPGNDPAGDTAPTRDDCTVWPPVYRVVKTTLAAYSCVRGNTIVYHVARYNRSGSVVLHASYPKARAAAWDRPVGRMSASMQQLVRTERRP